MKTRRPNESATAPLVAPRARFGGALRWGRALGLALALVPALAGAEKVLVKADTSLSMRDKPKSSASKIETLGPYAPVDIRKRDGDWAFITAPSGKTGWALSSYLTKTRYVGTNGDKVKIRRGPGADQDEIMTVGNHYPLRVLDAGEGWLKVEDYEGDRGWISQKMVTLDAYVITRLDEKPANIRKGPTVDDELLFTAERGVVLKVLKEKDGWLQVKHPDGDVGWISAKIVFGWLE